MTATYLITFSFQAEPEEAPGFIEAIESVSKRWKEKGIETRLFSDPKAPGLLMLHLLTEHGVDDVTAMVQEEPESRELFQKIRDTKSRVHVVFMEQVV